MSRKKFYFNPDTHQFIEIRRTKKQRLFWFFTFLLSAVFMAVVTYNLSSRLDLNPKINKLTAHQSRLLMQYDSLDHRLEYFGDVLTDMQIRDDSLYRTVFGIEPIPATVREVGLGGSNPYPLLLGFNTSDVMISTMLGLDKLELKASVQKKSFSDLINLALERKELLSNKPSIQPIPLDVFFYISSEFGSREDPINNEYALHKGIDFAARIGTEVYATGDGTVLLTKISSSGYGREILIYHGFGYTTRYAHLSSILVHTGQKIQRGTLIGTLGNSGKSTGPHLHYEVRLYNQALNPALFYADDLLPSEYTKIVTLANSVDN
jgi:hypothetical protein